MDDVRSNDPHATDGEHAMPRWVKGFVIAGIVVAVLIVVVLLAGGEHGPGRHQLGGGPSAFGAALG